MMAAAAVTTAAMVAPTAVDRFSTMEATYLVASGGAIEVRMMADVVVILPWMMNDEGWFIAPRVSPSP